jgi:hypothetical protein
MDSGVHSILKLLTRERAAIVAGRAVRSRNPHPAPMQFAENADMLPCPQRRQLCQRILRELSERELMKVAAEWGVPQGTMTSAELAIRLGTCLPQDAAA